MNEQKTNLMGVAFLLTLAVGAADSATLYKWVDENGNVIYQDTPPPENVQYEESTVDAPPAPLPDDAGKKIEEAALENPVSLYTVPKCDTCDLVRLFLERNSIPFAEKNVRNNIEMQAELEQRAGTLTVPTLVVGDRVLDGYSSNAIQAALLEAGFPMGQDESTGEEPGDESLEEGVDESPASPEVEISAESPDEDQ
jgi:glutaredoxin